MGTFRSKYFLPKQIVDKQLTYSGETIIVKPRYDKHMLLVPYDSSYKNKIIHLKKNQLDKYDFILKIKPNISFVIHDFIYTEVIDISHMDVYIKLLTKLNNKNTEFLYLGNNFDINFDSDAVKTNEMINKNLLVSSNLIYDGTENDTANHTTNYGMFNSDKFLQYLFYNDKWKRSDKQNNFNKYLILSNKSIYFDTRKDIRCIKTFEYYLFFIIVIIVLFLYLINR